MIRDVTHIGLTVSNLDEAIQFFQNIIGLEVKPITLHKGETYEKLMQIPGFSVRACNVHMPDSPDKDIIHLVEYLAPKGSKIDTKLFNPGVSHLAFLVNDVQKTYDDLTAKGVQFYHPPLWTERWGLCYFKGPDGIILELMEARKGV